jgi:hypothetical protein
MGGKGVCIGTRVEDRCVVICAKGCELKQVVGNAICLVLIKYLTLKLCS